MVSTLYKHNQNVSIRVTQTNRWWAGHGYFLAKQQETINKETDCGQLSIKKETQKKEMKEEYKE